MDEAKAIETVAKWIYLMEDLWNYIDIDKYSIKEIYAEHKELWPLVWADRTAEHCGDCTNVPMPCGRCQIEETIAHAKAELGIKDD